MNEANYRPAAQGAKRMSRDIARYTKMDKNLTPEQLKKAKAGKITPFPKGLERKIKAAEKAGNIKSWKALRAKQRLRRTPDIETARAKAAAAKARKKGIKQGHIVHKPGVRRGLTASYRPMYSTYLDFLQEAKKKKGFRPDGMRRKRLDIGRAKLAGTSPTSGRLKKMVSRKVQENIMGTLMGNSDDNNKGTGGSGRAKAAKRRSQAMRFRQLKKKTASRAGTPLSHAWTGKMHDHLSHNRKFQTLVITELKSIRMMTKRAKMSGVGGVSLRGAARYIRQQGQLGRAQGSAAATRHVRKTTKGVAQVGRLGAKIAGYGGKITNFLRGKKGRGDTTTPSTPERKTPSRPDRPGRTDPSWKSRGEVGTPEPVTTPTKKPGKTNLIARANKVLAKSKETMDRSDVARQKADAWPERKIAGRVLSARARKGKGSTNIRLGGTAFKK